MNAHDSRIPSELSSQRPPKKRPDERWESFADRLIAEAQERGDFDHLPGFGQPSPLIDAPYDEHWWLRDKLKHEQLTNMPPALAIREDVRRTLEQARQINDEPAVRQLLEALNERIHHANQSGRAGPTSTTLPVDIEQFLAENTTGQTNAG